MVNAKRVAAIARISPQRLRYWEDTGLVAPAAVKKISPRNTVRLYSLDGLVQVVVAAKVVESPGVSLQHLRQIIAKLETIDGYRAPLAEVTFAIDGSKVYMQHADGTWEDSRAHKGQLVEARLVVNMELVRRTVEEGLRKRRRDQVGRVEKRRGVHGSKPVFAGTRVPVAAVRSFLKAGAEDDEILEAYPNLTRDDIEAVRSGTVRSA